MNENPYAIHDLDKASEYLRLSIPLLSKYKIPPSPVNYRVGYEYVAGGNEELRAAFDEAVAKSPTISPQALWDLYRRFFVQDDVVLERIRDELRHIIVNIQGEFQRSGGNISTYAQSLNRFADILNPETPLSTMAAEVQKVVAETRSVEQSQRQLESDMSNVVREVETLRRELEQVRKEAMTDALTGISNRKAFDAALENTVYTAREKAEPFCLLLIDIDHFKAFNDTHGHLVGDKVLRFVATTLKRCVKGNDMPARYGGEEFAVILPNTAFVGAEAVSEQIRRAISAGELLNRESGQRLGKITVSIGMAQFRRNELPHELIQRADQALYLAKERGRNRVEKAA